MNYYNYFTEIEEHFVKRRGKNLLVSPLDWSLIATWRDSGVPLNVALRGIEAAMDNWKSRPRRISDRLSTLFYCHDAVMAEFARHLESHVGEGAQPASAGESSQAERGLEEVEELDRARVLAFLNARLSEIGSLPAKLMDRQKPLEAVARVLQRLEDIIASAAGEARIDGETLERDLGILEEVLVGELRAALPEALQAQWQQEAKKDLKTYRKRLPKETYQRILENYMRNRVRRYFEIGELSLFHA